MEKISLKKNEILTHLLPLALLSYAYLSSATGLNSVVTGPRNFYYLKELSFTLGFILWALIHHLYEEIKNRRRMLFLTTAIFLAGVAGAALTPALPEYALILMLAPAFIALGITGGLVYYRASLLLTAVPGSGKITSFFMALPEILLFISGRFLGSPSVLMASLIISMILLCFCLRTDVHDTPVRSSLTGSYYLVLHPIFHILTVVFLTLFILPQSIFFQTEPSVQSTAIPGSVRLVLILSYVIMGVIFDLRKPPAMPLCALLGILPAAIVPLVTDHANNGFAVFLSFFATGCYTAYCNFNFWQLSPFTRNPRLTASAGRYMSFLRLVLGASLPGILLKGKAFLAICELIIMLILIAVIFLQNIAETDEVYGDYSAAKDSGPDAAQSSEDSWASVNAELSEDAGASEDSWASVRAELSKDAGQSENAGTSVSSGAPEGEDIPGNTDISKQNKPSTDFGIFKKIRNSHKDNSQSDISSSDISGAKAQTLIPGEENKEVETKDNGQVSSGKDDLTTAQRIAEISEFYKKTTLSDYGSLPVREVSKSSEDMEGISPSDAGRSFSEEYSLTKREVEVLDAICGSEAPITRVSEELSMSRTMLYRYLKSIYKKTGCSERDELTKKYRDFQGK
ncbi:MAG: MFS transporter [Lachnospiraceae bacterium]|nr:MFS transporter [Lachnospiraceae bacterium]